MYQRGLGVSRNYSEAVRWFRKAAEQGSPEGQYNLGLMYRQGLGVQRNEREAEKWLRLAAAQGYAAALQALGMQRP